MAGVSILASIYGILQHYFIDFLPKNSVKLYDPRSYSFFDNANFFGSYLVLIILLSISLYLIENRTKLLSFYLIAIAFAFSALTFSETRSGYVGVFLGILLITNFVIYKRKFLWGKWIKLLLTLGIIFAVINIFEDGNYSKRFNTFFTDSIKLASKENVEQIGSYRFFIWKKSLPLIDDYFWIGSGPDTFEYVFPNDKEKKQIFGDMIVDKAHNEYLHMAITLGVPALLIYLSLIAAILYKALSAVRVAEGNEKIFLLCLLATIIGYLAQAFFNISVVPVAPLFWAFLGITLARSEFALNKSKRLHEELINKIQSA
ncbi:O-antigen ligase [Bacillus sp. FJAT-29814]|uniref:O-antigen ligase family protein n=1 Tax=Bacillus sp. FJAT-29814 TaxID=1729688 RepID=UPI001560D151|nr:O-antigen ligase family protein [Bacillus sp. FJAT-29814]